MTKINHDITIKSIESEEDYDAALGQIAALMDAGPGTPEEYTLVALAKLVETYEDEHYPMSQPEPITALRFRMEQEGLSL